MPNRLVHRDPVRFNIGQTQAEQFSGSKPRFSGKPVERPQFTLGVRNDLRNTIKAKILRSLPIRPKASKIAALWLIRILTCVPLGQGCWVRT